MGNKSTPKGDSDESAYVAEERTKPQRIWLTEEQLDLLAERAAAKALENFYLEVGKVTVRSSLYILGAGLIALFGWLALTGKISV